MANKYMSDNFPQAAELEIHVFVILNTAKYRKNLKRLRLLRPNKLKKFIKKF